MRLTLVVPGLLWPERALHDTVFDLELPALSQLISRGKTQWLATQPVEQALCRVFGITADELPAGALRLLGERDAPAPGRDVWLCADCVHLAIEQQRLILAGEDLELDATETQAITHAVRETLHALPGFAEFFLTEQGRGYARFSHPLTIRTTPPSAAVGLTIEQALPRGPDARAWARIGNELAMRLAALATNRAREAAGRHTVSTLWFWGAGTLPRPAPASFDTLHATDALAHGLARWAGIACLPPDADVVLSPAESALVVIEDLQHVAQALDATAWRAALADFERQWLAPLYAKLAAGALRELAILALGSEATLEITAHARDRLKFWRSARPLHQLLAPTP